MPRIDLDARSEAIVRQEIDDRIAAEAPARAAAFIADVGRDWAALARFPEMGRRRDDFGRGMRTVRFDRRVPVADRLDGDRVATGSWSAAAIRAGSPRAPRRAIRQVLRQAAG